MKRVVSLLALAPIAACAGSETGNGQNEYRDVQVTMIAFNGLPVLAAFDEDGVAFDIDAAYARVDRLDFILCDDVPCTERVEANDVTAAYEVGCEADGKLRVAGPWTVDLVTGAFDPPLGTLELPASEYERVDVTMSPGGAEPVAGTTFFVGGTFVVDGQTRHYTVTLDFQEKVRFVADAPFALDEPSPALALHIDVRGWFTDLPVSACAAAGEVPIEGGVYRLDETRPSCANVTAAIRKAINDASKVKKAADRE